MIALQFVFIYMYHVRQNLNIFHEKKLFPKKFKKILETKRKKNTEKSTGKKKFEI